jgi:hypothetical protein
VRFLFEHSLSPRLATAIDALEGPDGHQVVHIRTIFADQSVEDTVWIPAIGRDHPDDIVVTADPAISRKIHERAAWLEARLTMFFVRGFADHKHWDQAAKLVKWWPDIVKQATRAKRGAGYLVTAHGRIEQLEPPRSARGDRDSS